MKDFIPSEEDFEVLLSALATYERDLITRYTVEEAMKPLKGIDLTNDEAFTQAFSKASLVGDTEKLMARSKAVRDKVIVIGAKLVQLRDHIKQHQLNGAISDLLK